MICLVKATMNKTVKVDLTTIDVNAFALMAAFSKQARKESWSKEEIDTILNKCRAGDYNHLVATLVGVCE